MKVFIGGGGGFIGGHLARVHLDRGDEVVVADIKAAEQWYQHHTEAENLVLNLEEKEASGPPQRAARWFTTWLATWVGWGSSRTTRRSAC